MTMGNGDRYVTWKQFVAILLGVVTVPIVISWVLYTTLGAREYAILSEQMGMLKSDMRVQIQELRTEIRDLQTFLRTYRVPYEPKRPTKPNPETVE